MPLRRTPALVQGVVLLLLPHGGQGTARRNAWAGMSADAALGRDRRAAEAALDAAEQRAHARHVLRDATSG